MYCDEISNPMQLTLKAIPQIHLKESFVRNRFVGESYITSLSVGVKTSQVSFKQLSVCLSICF